MDVAQILLKQFSSGFGGEYGFEHGAGEGWTHSFLVFKGRGVGCGPILKLSIQKNEQ